MQTQTRLKAQRAIQVNETGGVFIALLTVLFIGLKLTGHVDWSLWWVLSPIWIGAALALAFLLLFILFAKHN